MAQGERLKGHDSCTIQKFDGPPGELKKVGEFSNGSASKPEKTSILKQPNFEEEKPSFQGKVKF